MAINRFLIVIVAFAAALCGCGGGSTFTFVAKGTGNPVANSSSISIVFQPALPQSVAVGSMTQIAAAVSNDQMNEGVDWLVTCSAMDCGSLTLGTTSGRAIHSESEQAITYTAPSDVIGNQLAVNIVAFAAADHTKNILATITVSGP